jgi:hypothetical protein
MHQQQLDRIERKLDLLLGVIKDMSTQISANLQALMTQVAANTSVEGSAVTLIQGIAAQLTAALQNSDDAALPALVTQLNTFARLLRLLRTRLPRTATAAAATVASATKVP